MADPPAGKGGLTGGLHRLHGALATKKGLAQQKMGQTEAPADVGHRLFGKNWKDVSSQSHL